MDKVEFKADLSSVKINLEAEKEETQDEINRIAALDNPMIHITLQVNASHREISEDTGRMITLIDDVEVIAADICGSCPTGPSIEP